MKKIFTLFWLLVFMAANSISLLKAQVPAGYYKKYHIDQNFNGLEAFPLGWEKRTAATAIFRGGDALVGTDVLKTSGSGSGNRGVDVFFPSPQSNTIIGQPADSIWYLEMDWVINGATLGARNALGLMVSGSHNQNINVDATYYADAIFGLYVFGDGFLHYMNIDQQGPLRSEILGTAWTGDPTERYGPAISSGAFPSFKRSNTSATVSAQINASTLTSVTYAAGKTYHLTAIMNFSTQKVMKLIIADKADPLNADTIEDKAFLAPTLVGTAPTIPVEQRLVKDVAIISGINTRSSYAGNGSNANLNVYYDNIQIYRPELSLGQADVTINYKDRLGNLAKAPRVVPSQEISTIYSLLMSDKAGFIEGSDYFAYDATATHTANAGKGNNDGESVVVNTNASIDVIFKKSPMTIGTYTWTGANGFNWSELDDNFSVSGGAAQSFQNGNGAAFSNVDATNKEVQIPANLNLGVGDFAVSAAGYSFSGTGRLEGTGSLLISAPTTIGIDNRLTGGAIINTAEPVQINHASAATKYVTTLGNVYLKLNPSAAFSAPITGNGGILNIDAMAEYVYSSPITKFSTVNFNLANVGKASNNNWTNPITSIFTDSNVVVNVRDISNQDTLPMTYAVAPTSVALAKVNLGDDTRLIHNGTPGAGSTISVKIGELSGTAKSSLEGNSVVSTDRTIEFAIGGLNTNAVFNGRILPQRTKYPSRHAGTELVFEPETTPGDTTWYIPSPLKLKKVGKGSWTVNGEMLFGGDINVVGGTLVLGNKVAPTVTQIKVDTAATLVVKNIKAESIISVNIGTLSGAVNANSISLTGSTLKMNVNSFADGDYDKIVTVGDMTTIAAVSAKDLNILDITVKAAAPNQKIKLIEVLGNADVTFNKIFVNGEDITLNTPETVGAKFVYSWNAATAAGELTSLTTIATGLDQVATQKAIKSVQYFNATGKVVGMDAQGFLIKKTTYVDGTQSIQKMIRFDR
ncbi:MAG TPA: hypothetical protein VFP20_02785 [Bacteroidales bacterium]|nr:hypothetical protein [Bacteroidales bacterium]